MRDRVTRTAGLGAAIVVAAGALYAMSLDRLYLVHDEVVFALNAHAIAHTLRDLNGQLLPVSIYVTDTFFATPVSIYFTALVLAVAPLTEVTVRLPAVAIGLLNILLVYAIGRRIFRSASLAVLAAALLTLTPAHFIHSRMGTDHEYAVAAVLAWMLCLVWRDGVASARRLVLAGAILGAGVYTYLGAAITMPVCLALTWVMMWQQGARRLALYAAPLVGFAVLLLPLLAWHATHPDQYLRQMRMYSLAGASPVAEAQPAGGLSMVADRVSVYWDYFNPSFLFLAGDTSLINGTRYSGVFLWPMAIFLPIGVYLLLTRPAALWHRLLVLSLLAAPLAATVVGERYRINRALVLLPMAALVATIGVEAMWTARRWWWRAAAIGLLALMPLQFAGFYRDYFDGYPARSYAWLEYNIRGGLEDLLIARRGDPPAPIYIANNIAWVDYYWPFYLVKHDRTSLRTHLLRGYQRRPGPRARRSR